MADHAIKEVIAIFNRSFRYREVKLKASITSDWLSFERDTMKFLFITEQK